MEAREKDVYSICQKIANVASLHPTKVAVCSNSLSITYDELVCRSATLATYLSELGIRSGKTVAICMERSVDWIVAALGILQTGAAYVPLDCEWAWERLRYTSEDSGASFIIGRRQVLRDLKLSIPVLDMDDGSISLTPTPMNSCNPPLAEDLAYVIYTSGSTGAPKGVEITHSNLAHLVRWQLSAADLSSEDRVSHLAGLAFDAAVWEIWPSLVAGATIVIPDTQTRVSAELLKQWLADQQVTVSYIPTILAMSMIRSEWPENTSLRLLLTGGDTLPRGPIHQLPFRVINNYGPTECTVVSTSGLVQAFTQGPPSIGRPITDTSIYILDEKRQRVAKGTIGEIYIGGSGVGRGYRNLPEATREVFIPDPFVPDHQGKRNMYKSGDLGVERPNGVIEFKGRRDRQVKLRGFRIELDEISHVLSIHENVAFATVLLTDPGSCNAKLVAYVLPTDKQLVLTARQMQEHLRVFLPDYMIPSLFVRLSALPLSANAKVDLSLLKTTEPLKLLPDGQAREPVTVVEKQLLHMMRTLLKCSQITIDDDFFLVGGHSLIAMQLILRLRDAFGVDLTLRQIFRSSTLSKLAGAIQSQLDLSAVEPEINASTGHTLNGVS